MKSTSWEHSNDILHNSKSPLDEKILIVAKLPETTLTGKISIIISATALKKYFFGSTFKDEATDLCC